MRYVSLFSGIEAVSVAWRDLGWEPVAFSEIAPFPCEVLKQRFPGVPNLGDITQVDWNEVLKEYGTVDLVVGGSPCQSFSIAGSRSGLDGESGLMWEYVRAVRELRPRYVLWENVPGALSSCTRETAKGDDFRCLLSALDDLGYGVAGRVLDAQFFGVPQRRRRIFLVGCLGDPISAAEILFEPESLRWDNPSSRDKRKELTRAASNSVESSDECITPCATLAFDPTQVTSPQNGNNPQWNDESHTLAAAGRPPHVCIAFSAGQPSEAGSIAAQEEVAPTLRASRSGSNQVPSICFTWNGGSGFSSNDDLSPTLRSARCGEPAICVSGDHSRAAIDKELAGTLLVGGDPPFFLKETVVRRLMPIECERLQGFPDGWTDIGDQHQEAIDWSKAPDEMLKPEAFAEFLKNPAKRKVKTSDSARYAALGNSIAVPVLTWIGKRIDEMEYNQ